ncbi:hypothetical protein GCM10022393_38230 [Aquimarina addita]|uniref:Outer membrane protein assembly factor BamB n=1 Tax=Aquimarina addita TaxID=870485 RepID=A0ABP6USZ2_9FLAO
MKRIYALVLCFITTFYSINAQEKLWQVDLKETLSTVGWIKQSNDGVIIASGSKGLVGLNNMTGETIWHNKELKAINKNTFLTIDGLPLFYVEYAPVAGKTRGIIINSSNGDILYDTKDDGSKIKNFTVIADKGIILFELITEKERNIMSFSLKTWEKNWVAPLGESKGLMEKFAGASFINHGPYFTNDNNIVIGLKDEIFGIHTETGEIQWTHKADKRIKALVYSDINNSLYLGIKKSKVLTVLDPSDGKDITPGKLKLKGTLIDVRPYNGNLILVETEGFNIIDPQTNEFKWKKSFKIDFLDEVIPNEKGYIAIGKDEKDGTIALVDKEGQKIWDSKVKGYAYYVTPTPKGVIYISTERSNILDFEKGKDVWDKDVKFRSIPAVTYDQQEDKVVLFENKKGYKFDLNTGVIELFAEDIQLKEVSKKTPLLAEYVDGAGYLINADQHISLLSPEGSLVYTEYYNPASSIGGLMSVAQLGLSIAGVDLDIAGAMDNIETLSALSSGSGLQTSQDQTDGTSETNIAAGLYVGTADNMATVFEVTKTRYTNSKSIRSHKFIVAKVKGGDDGTKHFIYMINKKTGAIDKQIELLDKTPNYLIDEIDTITFINEKNHIISAHKF